MKKIQKKKKRNEDIISIIDVQRFVLATICSNFNSIELRYETIIQFQELGYIRFTPIFDSGGYNMTELRMTIRIKKKHAQSVLCKNTVSHDDFASSEACSKSCDHDTDPTNPSPLHQLLKKQPFFQTTNVDAGFDFSYHNLIDESIGYISCFDCGTICAYGKSGPHNGKDIPQRCKNNHLLITGNHEIKSDVIIHRRGSSWKDSKNNVYPKRQLTLAQLLGSKFTPTGIHWTKNIISCFACHIPFDPRHNICPNGHQNRFSTGYRPEVKIIKGEPIKRIQFQAYGKWKHEDNYSYLINIHDTCSHKEKLYNPYDFPLIDPSKIIKSQLVVPETIVELEFSNEITTFVYKSKKKNNASAEEKPTNNQNDNSQIINTIIADPLFVSYGKKIMSININEKHYPNYKEFIDLSKKKDMFYPKLADLLKLIDLNNFNIQKKFLLSHGAIFFSDRKQIDNSNLIMLDENSGFVYPIVGTIKNYAIQVSKNGFSLRVIPLTFPYYGESLPFDTYTLHPLFSFPTTNPCRIFISSASSKTGIKIPRGSTLNEIIPDYQLYCQLPHSFCSYFGKTIKKKSKIVLNNNCSNCDRFCNTIRKKNNEYVCGNCLTIHDTKDIILENNELVQEEFYDPNSQDIKLLLDNRQFRKDLLKCNSIKKYDIKKMIDTWLNDSISDVTLRSHYKHLSKVTNQSVLIEIIEQTSFNHSLKFDPIKDNLSHFQFDGTPIIIHDTKIPTPFELIYQYFGYTYTELEVFNTCYTYTCNNCYYREKSQKSKEVIVGQGHDWYLLMQIKPNISFSNFTWITKKHELIIPQLPRISYMGHPAVLSTFHIHGHFDHYFTDSKIICDLTIKPRNPLKINKQAWMGQLITNRRSMHKTNFEINPSIITNNKNFNHDHRCCGKNEKQCLTIDYNYLFKSTISGKVPLRSPSANNDLDLVIPVHHLEIQKKKELEIGKNENKVNFIKKEIDNWNIIKRQDNNIPVPMGLINAIEQIQLDPINFDEIIGLMNEMIPYSENLIHVPSSSYDINFEKKNPVFPVIVWSSNINKKKGLKKGKKNVFYINVPISNWAISDHSIRLLGLFCTKTKKNILLDNIDEKIKINEKNQLPQSEELFNGYPNSNGYVTEPLIEKEKKMVYHFITFGHLMPFISEVYLSRFLYHSNKSFSILAISELISDITDLSPKKVAIFNQCDYHPTRSNQFRNKDFIYQLHWNNPEIYTVVNEKKISTIMSKEIVMTEILLDMIINQMDRWIDQYHRESPIIFVTANLMDCNNSRPMINFTTFDHVTEKVLSIKVDEKNVIRGQNMRFAMIRLLVFYTKKFKKKKFVSLDQDLEYNETIPYDKDYINTYPKWGFNGIAAGSLLATGEVFSKFVSFTTFITYLVGLGWVYGVEENLIANRCNINCVPVLTNCESSNAIFKHLKIGKKIYLRKKLYDIYLDQKSLVSSGKDLIETDEEEKKEQNISKTFNLPGISFRFNKKKLGLILGTTWLFDEFTIGFAQEIRSYATNKGIEVYNNTPLIINPILDIINETIKPITSNSYIQNQYIQNNYYINSNVPLRSDNSYDNGNIDRNVPLRSDNQYFKNIIDFHFQDTVYCFISYLLFLLNVICSLFTQLVNNWLPITFIITVYLLFKHFIYKKNRLPKFILYKKIPDTFDVEEWPKGLIIIDEDYPDIDRENHILVATMGTTGDINPLKYYARLMATHGHKVAFRVIRQITSKELRLTAEGKHWFNVPEYLNLQYLYKGGWSHIYSCFNNSPKTTCLSLGCSKRYVGNFQIGKTLLGFFTKIVTLSVLVDFQVNNLKYESDIPRSPDGLHMLDDKRHENKNTGKIGYLFGSDQELRREHEDKLKKLGYEEITDTNHMEAFKDYNEIYCHGGASTMNTIISRGAIAHNLDSSLDRNFYRPLTPDDFVYVDPLPILVQSFWQTSQPIPINWLIHSMSRLLHRHLFRKITSLFYFSLKLFLFPYSLLQYLYPFLLILTTLQPFTWIDIPYSSRHTLPIFNILWEYPIIMLYPFLSPFIIISHIMLYFRHNLCEDIAFIFRHNARFLKYGDKQYWLCFHWTNLGNNFSIPGHISIYDAWNKYRWEGEFVKEVGLTKEFKFVKRIGNEKNGEPIQRYNKTTAFILPFNIDVTKLNSMVNEHGFYGPFYNCQMYLLRACYQNHVLLLIPLIIACLIGWFLMINFYVFSYFEDGKPKNHKLFNLFEIPKLAAIDDFIISPEKEYENYKKNIKNKDNFKEVVDEIKKKINNIKSKKKEFIKTDDEINALKLHILNCIISESEILSEPLRSKVIMELRIQILNEELNYCYCCGDETFDKNICDFCKDLCYVKDSSYCEKNNQINKKETLKEEYNQWFINIKKKIQDLEAQIINYNEIEQQEIPKILMSLISLYEAGDEIQYTKSACKSYIKETEKSKSNEEKKKKNRFISKRTFR